MQEEQRQFHFRPFRFQRQGEGGVQRGGHPGGIVFEGRDDVQVDLSPEDYLAVHRGGGPGVRNGAGRRQNLSLPERGKGFPVFAPHAVAVPKYDVE